MKYLSLLLMALAMACNMTLAQQGHLYRSALFSSGLINSICQDNYGYVWIATDYGLNRFDGYHFTSYQHESGDSTSLGNSMVVCVCCDIDGRLWAGTNKGLDCFDYERNTFTHYNFPDGVKPRVTQVRQFADRRVLVLTAGYGLYAITGPADAKDGGMVKVSDDYTAADDNNYFTSMLCDREGRVWKSGIGNHFTIKDRQGARRIESSLGAVQEFVEHGNEVLVVCMHGIYSYRGGVLAEADIDLAALGAGDVIMTSALLDSQGNLYIGTRGDGLFCMAKGSRRLERIDCITSELDLSTAKIEALTEDRHGNLWIGCQSKGLLMMPSRQPQFQSWSFSAQGMRLGSTVTSVCEGNGGMTWCTMQGNGVYGFDRRGRIVAHPSAPSTAEFIFRDKQGCYWLGTDNSLYAYDPVSGKAVRKVMFDCDKFNDMTSDRQGNIYISTFSRGFCVYNPATEQLRNYTSLTTDTVRGRLCNNWVMAMMPDRNGHIWLATSSGVSCYDPQADSFLTSGFTQLLDGVLCFSLCERRDGTIVIGTEDGIYSLRPDGKQGYKLQLGVGDSDGQDALQGKTVGYIIEANNGDLWCATSSGIWQYDQDKHTFIGHVHGNGLTTTEYIVGAGLHTDNDIVYFANNDGLTVFRPSEVTGSHSDLPDLHLTAFLIAGKPVSTLTLSNGTPVTDRTVMESDEFRVSYLDSSVALEFSLLDFNNALNVSLEYRIDDSQWQQTPEGQNSIQLSHLQPGTYRIDVRAVAAGLFSPTKTITVCVTPPWYSTTAARIFYLLIAICIAMALAWVYRRRTTMELNEEKMKFLINATHEIRSPLTLIMGALGKLKSGRDKDGATVTAGQEASVSLRGAVEVIEHNSNRILNLVNQILDVRKIDKRQLRLYCEKTDIVSFTRDVCKMFDYYAKERNIKFEVKHEGIESADVWIDRNQFDKVITNLLSNAFKYSHDNGEITVSIEQNRNGGSGEEGNIVLKVTDTGMGLDADSMKHVFDRFYQGSNSRHMHIAGTGIGLNLCKMIVDMHHGTIEAQNRTDGNGAVFTVTLPLGNKHLKEEEMEEMREVKEAKEMRDTEEKSVPASTESVSPQPSDERQPQASPHPASEEKPKGTSSKHHVLVVDDDIEIGHYISTELAHYYKFTVCQNGKEGLKELLTGGDYAAVVSDVMMPVMDGFTMLRMIKTNMNISHIPVIMLTSMSDVGNRMEGLERGADAFIAKPFNMDELHLTIDNLIQSRQRLRGKFTGTQHPENIESIEVKGNNEQLMERIVKAINKNLSDSDFNVEMLTQEVGISRAQLHRKMKEMTGLTTSEFIRNIRLEQAARLLKEQKVNITQVAYIVGFSNLAHFSTLFRKHFGVPPSEYAES